MIDIKQKLLFIAPILTLIVFIFVIVLIIKPNEEDPITFSNATITPHKPLTKYNTFKEQGAYQYNSAPIKREQSWQDSLDIKYDDYTFTDTGDIRVNANTVATINNSENIETPTDTDTNSLFIDVWNWLPSRDLTNHAKPPEPVTKPSKQEVAMRDYGNVIGSTIKSFTLQASDQPKTMLNFMQDRANKEAAQDLVNLGNMYIELSKDLSLIDMPTNIERVASKFTAAYSKVGDATIDLAKSTDDDDTLNRVYSYNSVIEDFARSFMKLSNIFGAYGVTFSKGEGGDIFMPPM